MYHALKLGFKSREQLRVALKEGKRLAGLAAILFFKICACSTFTSKYTSDT